MDGYQYDVFISYKRQPPVGDWVANHFHPMLEGWLAQNLPRPVSIFRDPDIDIGSRWPDRLANALRCSRCLVAVWSPPYFQSHWCIAEWTSMLERERLIGWFSSQNPAGLAWPVVFADGKYFPEAIVKDREYRDFSMWNHPYIAFRETTKFLDFDTQVQKFAEALSGAILTAPPWQGNFPVVLPNPPLQPPKIPLPGM